MEEKRRIKENKMKKSNNSRDTLGSVVQGLWLFRLFPDKSNALSMVFCFPSVPFPGEPDLLYLYHIPSSRKIQQERPLRRILFISLKSSVWTVDVSLSMS
jgi:hypothetical protein